VSSPHRAALLLQQWWRSFVRLGRSVDLLGRELQRDFEAMVLVDAWDEWGPRLRARHASYLLLARRFRRYPFPLDYWEDVPAD